MKLAHILLILPCLICSCERGRSIPATLVISDTVNAFTSPNFKILSLSHDDYYFLKSCQPGPHQLVFQFSYPASTIPTSPLLKVYGMKQNQKAINDSHFEICQKMLTAGADSQVPVYGPAQTLGNLQVSVNAIDVLIAHSTSSQNFTALIFTPLLDNGTIVYEITVDQQQSALAPLRVNPSPPYSSL